MTAGESKDARLLSSERKELLLLRKLKWCCANTHMMYDYLTDDSIRAFFLENDYEKNKYHQSEDTDEFLGDDVCLTVPKRGAVPQIYLVEIIRKELRSSFGKKSAELCLWVYRMLPERGPWCEDWDDREWDDEREKERAGR